MLKIDLKWKDIDLLTISQEDWDILAIRANHYLELAEKVHNKRCEGNLEMQAPYEALLDRYAGVIQLLRLVAPVYIKELSLKVHKAIMEVQEKMMSEPELIPRHLRLMDQYEILIVSQKVRNDGR